MSSGGAWSKLLIYRSVYRLLVGGIVDTATAAANSKTALRLAIPRDPTEKTIHIGSVEVLDPSS